MMKIQLHGKFGDGKFTIVDDDDYIKFNNITWTLQRFSRKFHEHYAGYVVGRINKKSRHLRIVTHKESTLNRNKFSTSKSEFKGISWHKNIKKWQAQIQIRDKRTSIGYFENQVEAAQNYDYHAKNIYGNFVPLNFPDFDYSNFIPKKIIF